MLVCLVRGLCISPLFLILTFEQAGQQCWRHTHAEKAPRRDIWKAKEGAPVVMAGVAVPVVVATKDGGGDGARVLGLADAGDAGPVHGRPGAQLGQPPKTLGRKGRHLYDRKGWGRR